MAGTRAENRNEREVMEGEIEGNIWDSDMIVSMSPENGHVSAWIDLTGLLPSDQMVDAESVLNGIAYDAQHDRLFVTGKQWPRYSRSKWFHDLRRVVRRGRRGEG